MIIDIISIFPEYFTPLDLSLIGKAQKKQLIEINCHNLRDWAHNTHRRVDDTPYGGGPGMIMRPDIWAEAVEEFLKPESYIIVPTPTGKVFTQELAQELTTCSHMIFMCGRYEGIDQRVLDYYSSCIKEISLGDFIVMGGEVATLAIIEAVVRLLPGVIGNEQSYCDDSFHNNLLEGPRYTRPPVWRDRAVPEVLLGGHHERIAEWNLYQAQERTRSRRPDLWNEAEES